MGRGAIIVFLINVWFCAFSQNISYSRSYPGNRKNIPVAILNNHTDYFYLLRYNKAAHDLIVERRSKPAAEILSFTPLKLDSVNASWFDYEKLDYLFFELEGRVFFLFEKVLNTEKTIYLRELDSTGKLKGFMPLAVLKKEASMIDFIFEFKLINQNQILIIGTQVFHNASAKKTAILYSPLQTKKLWQKTLPLENSETGYSISHTCNERGDLFYILPHVKLLGYKRKYKAYAQFAVPLLFYETLSLVQLFNENDSLIRKRIPLNGLNDIYACLIIPKSQDLFLHLYFTRMDGANNLKPMFYSLRLPMYANSYNYATTSELENNIEKKLTYFDGTDFDIAADKQFSLTEFFSEDQYVHFFAERNEDGFYKEVLYWKLNLIDGRVERQALIPRKIYFFRNRSNFKSLGSAVFLKHHKAFIIFLLEHQTNHKVSPENFSFHKFKKQEHLKGGSLVAYTVNDNGGLSKKALFLNTDYDFVPLKYSGKQDDFIFYLNKAKVEKFAMLSLDGL